MDDGVRESSLLLRAATPIGVIFFALGYWVTRSTRFADFRVLYLGADVSGAGDWSSTYDAALFTAIAQSRPDMTTTHRELDVFLSTPPFAWAMQIFTLLPVDSALVLWTVLGIAAVIAAVRLLGLPMWVAPIALVMPFGVSNFHHAQTGFFAILLAAAIHTACIRDRKIVAGLLAGLVILKPTLLIGVVLWWLIDWKRWYPSLLAAAASAGLLSLPVLLSDGLEPWRLFRESSEARVAVEVNVTGNEPTIRQFAKRLLGGEVGASSITIVCLVALGALVLWKAHQRWSERIDVLSGVAMFISIMVSPHLFIYDSGLILVPLAVAYAAGVPERRMEQMTAIYALTTLATIMSLPPFGLINEWIAPGALGIMVIAVIWVRAIEHAPPPLGFVTSRRPRAIQLST